jgi:protein TonB
MTRDLLLGSLLSLGLHLLLVTSNSPKIRVAAPPVDDVGDRVQLFPPPVDPEEPEVFEPVERDIKPLDIAPPMQIDVPQPVTPEVFVQKVQPPPPTGVTTSPNMIVVPSTRDPGAFARLTVFDPKALDQQPVPKFQAAPQYPFDMRRTGTPGEVVVDFIVDARGAVQNAFALRSSQREFEAAAVLAVSKWKFRPGRKDGRDVATHMQVPIVFTLHDQ